ncbi:MAG: hypothetical protein F6K19_52030 [Cyanothece sp. SIO1E1]|nr:hypothetical protein [Cyanothece sp. SIO1E1]
MPLNKKGEDVNNNKTRFNQEEILSNLKNFHGTEGYYRHSPLLFPKFLLTDGAHYLAESCEAYWLMDFIASYQETAMFRNHEKLQQYQFWYLTVKDSQGFIRCEWDTDEIVLEKKIPYTDFPLESARIWVCPWFPTAEHYERKDRYYVAMLPSEY